MKATVLFFLVVAGIVLASRYAALQDMAALADHYTPEQLERGLQLLEGN